MRLYCGKNRLIGRSGEAQTRGLRIPNAARYQLRYTPIVIKLWSCKWSNLWSNTFLTAIFCFPNRPKSARLKGFRRFSLSCGANTVYAPKPGAIPTSLYPDKDMPPASGRHIYYTSFFPRLQGKNSSRCLLYSGAFPPRRITAPAPPSERPPDRSFPRPRPGPPGPYGRRPPAYDRWAFADPDRG